MYTTYAVSAFWHGFYLAYYVFFFQVAMLCQLGKRFYNTDWPKYIPYTHILKWPVIFWMWITLNYFGLCFSIIDAGELYTFMSATYFIPSLGVVACMLFFTVTGIHKKKRGPPQREPQGSKETKTE